MPPTTNRNVQAESSNFAQHRVLYSHREVFTAAQINAGAIVLFGNRNYKIRVVNVILLALGGAASGATAVTINSVQLGTALALVTAAVAALTQDTPITVGTASVTVIGAGRLYLPNDLGTTITIAKTGGTLAGATGVQVVITYSLEKS